MSKLFSENNKIKYENCAFLVEFHTQKTSKWLSYNNINIYKNIILFLSNFNQKYKIYDYHIVITFIYFKRLINLGVLFQDPFSIFVLSLLLTIKFWDESMYICQHSPIRYKNLINYEYKILNSNFDFMVTLNLFNESSSVLLDLSRIF